MNDSFDRLEWFKNSYRKFAEDITDVNDWKYLQEAAIYRKHAGDLVGAIEAMVKAIGLTRTVPALAKETAANLNYLADLFLAKNAIEQADRAIREAVDLSRPLFPDLLADNLWILAGIQSQKGEHRKALASAEEARHLYQQQGHAHGVARAEELIQRINTLLG
jgi:tetratricopeptide (TPR) repeat protein